MIKRILITTAIGFSLLCAGWADGGWGANDEPGGGQYPKMCYHYIASVGWVLTSNC
jgi:hypothetical protein